MFLVKHSLKTWIPLTNKSWHFLVHCLVGQTDLAQKHLFPHFVQTSVYTELLRKYIYLKFSAYRVSLFQFSLGLHFFSSCVATVLNFLPFTVFVAIFFSPTSFLQEMDYRDYGSDKMIHRLGRYSFLLGFIMYYILIKSSVRNLSHFYDIIKPRRKDYLQSQ